MCHVFFKVPLKHPFKEKKMLKLIRGVDPFNHRLFIYDTFHVQVNSHGFIFHWYIMTKGAPTYIMSPSV